MRFSFILAGFWILASRLTTNYHIILSHIQFENPKSKQIQTPTHERVFEIMASSKLISPALRATLNLHSSKLPAATSQLASAHLSSAPSGGKHELPGLKYDYGALERKLDIRFCYIKIQVMSFIRVMVSGFCSLIRCDDAFKTPMRALRREISDSLRIPRRFACRLTLIPMNWK